MKAFLLPILKVLPVKSSTSSRGFRGLMEGQRCRRTLGGTFILVSRESRHGGDLRSTLRYFSTLWHLLTPPAASCAFPTPPNHTHPIAGGRAPDYRSLETLTTIPRRPSPRRTAEKPSKDYTLLLETILRTAPSPLASMPEGPRGQGRPCPKEHRYDGDAIPGEKSSRYTGTNAMHSSLGLD